jgi:hypothetical protein
MGGLSKEASDVEFISLRIMNSSSSPMNKSPPKHTPQALLNEADTDHLDVITGDKVFLLSKSDLQTEFSTMNGRSE